MKYKIGLVGLGFVGNACSVGFETLMGDSVELREHDKYKNSECLETVVNNSDIVFLCLPTPMAEDGSCNTLILETVVKDCVKLAKKKKIFIIKSTVPPRTTETFQQMFPKHSFFFNPEYLTEKNWCEDFLNQDRVIIGYVNGAKDEDMLKIKNFYNDFAKKQKNPAKIVVCEAKEAEMAKIIANSFLATKVSFFNEMYDICKKAEINFDAAIDVVCLDKRIGSSHTRVPGSDGMRFYGGKCLPKDLNSLMFFAKQYDLDPMLLETIWSMCLLKREKYDWEEIPGATTENLNFNKNQ